MGTFFRLLKASLGSPNHTPIFTPEPAKPFEIISETGNLLISIVELIQSKGFSAHYFEVLDIKTTTSTCLETIEWMSFVKENISTTLSAYGKLSTVLEVYGKLSKKMVVYGKMST